MDKWYGPQTIGAIRLIAAVFGYGAQAGRDPPEMVGQCMRCNVPAELCDGCCRGLDDVARLHAKLYVVGNRTLTLGRWARTLGVSRNAIKYRLAQGWEMERVVGYFTNKKKRLHDKKGRI